MYAIVFISHFNFLTYQFRVFVTAFLVSHSSILNCVCVCLYVRACVCMLMRVWKCAALVGIQVLVYNAANT